MVNDTAKSGTPSLSELKDFLIHGDLAEKMAFFKHLEEGMEDSLRLRGSPTKPHIKDFSINKEVTAIGGYPAIEVSLLSVTFERGRDRDSFDVKLMIKDKGMGEYTADTEITYKDLVQRSEVSLKDTLPSSSGHSILGIFVNRIAKKMDDILFFKNNIAPSWD